MLNLATVHEAIADALPERECLVFRDRRFSWREVTERSRRLGSVLRAAGLGCHTERRGDDGESALANWESGQDHVALYLHNGNEYLESMLGCFKARAVPVNVNYRYGDDELLYLFGDARARAVVYHARFAPTVARIRDRLPEVRLFLQVEDDSGEPLLPGAIEYEAALAGGKAEVPAGLSEDDLYVLYTGGTTGMPKGVLWRHADVFRAALYGPAESADEVARRAAARTGPAIRSLPAPPFMHGAAHWAAFNMWFLGGTVIVQPNPSRLDPDELWSTVERERVTIATIVGDAFARPLVDQLRARSYDLSHLRRLTSGGAILSASIKDALHDLLPNVTIIDTLGSSESGTQASRRSDGRGQASDGAFRPGDDNLVLSADRSRPLTPGDDETGWLARRGWLPLGYYGDPGKTAETFPEIDGVRYSVPGDRARIGEDGTLVLLGRDSVTINTGGEKVFAEEVEEALKSHPGVYDTVVVGVPHERWGQQVTALVQWRDGVAASDDELRRAAGESVASYKLPKLVVSVERIVRSPSGKADYRWARQTALDTIAAS